VKQSRAVKKNLAPASGGITHRAGPILEDSVSVDTPCPQPFDAASNTRAFCVFKEWHRIERMDRAAAIHELGIRLLELAAHTIFDRVILLIDEAAFVDALFDAMDRHDRQLLGVCYFLLVDFNDDLVKTFVGYYKLPDERFKAFLSTLGLKKQDGTPRLAWSEFKKRALAR